MALSSIGRKQDFQSCKQSSSLCRATVEMRVRGLPCHVKVTCRLSGKTPSCLALRGFWGYRSTVGQVLCKHLIRVRFSMAPRIETPLVAEATLIRWWSSVRFTIDVR